MHSLYRGKGKRNGEKSRQAEWRVSLNQITQEEEPWIKRDLSPRITGDADTKNPGGAQDRRVQWECTAGTHTQKLP